VKARGSGKRRKTAERIRTRLHEAEATLEAIRTGQVDALVVSGPGGERTLTIEGATHPYSVLLNAMSDGAALLEPRGAILFGNRSLGEIAGAPIETLRGSMFQELVVSAERPGFEEFLREGFKESLPREFAFMTANGTTPVAVAISTLPLETNPESRESASRAGPTVLMAIVTDLTYRKKVEATRARLLERLMTAEDDERRRIARELHDETGQSLTALLIGLRAITDMAVPSEVLSVVLRLRDIAANTMDEVGRLARGLHPAVLDDLGLSAAARRYVGDFSKTFGSGVEFVAADLDSPRLAPLAAATMYRILQETLANVARHARATKIAVELERNESGLLLTVQDDGVGFEASRTRSEGAGLGLRGMLERVTLLGGAIQIQSSPGQGTRVRVHIPASSAFPPPGTSRGDAARPLNPTDRN
jgi:signal transduction histidine kinase